MSVSADVLREHLSYTAWASRHLVRAVEHLSHDELSHDFRFSERNILGTLVHIFAADRIWLSRVEGEPRTTFISEADYNLHVLQIDWPLIYDKWQEWAAPLTDGQVKQDFNYRNLKGDPHTSAIWEERKAKLV